MCKRLHVLKCACGCACAPAPHLLQADVVAHKGLKANRAVINDYGCVKRAIITTNRHKYTHMHTLPYSHIQTHSLSHTYRHTTLSHTDTPLLTHTDTLHSHIHLHKCCLFCRPTLHTQILSSTQQQRHAGFNISAHTYKKRTSIARTGPLLDSAVQTHTFLQPHHTYLPVRTRNTQALHTGPLLDSAV